MFILLTVDMMESVSNAPNPPLLLAIGEFPNFGHLEGIEKAAATLRSYGVRLWVVGQDLSQFEAVYKDTWSGFIGNAEAVQFMGITHPKTVDFLVERLGEHVVRKRRRVRGQPQEYEERRQVLNADQVSRLVAKNQKNQIVWRGGHLPLKLKITPYYEYMPWWFLRAGPALSGKAEAQGVADGVPGVVNAKKKDGEPQDPPPPHGNIGAIPPAARPRSFSTASDRP